MAFTLLIIARLPAAAVGGDEPLLLDVVVNGYSTHKIGMFTLRAGMLMAKRRELESLGLRVPAAAPRQSDKLVALAALPGIKSHIDQSTQTLYVSANDDALLPTLLHLTIHKVAEPPVQSGTGITLNYDFTGSRSGGESIASGTYNLRAFSPWGVLSSQALTYAWAGLRAGPNPAVRLDTTYTYSDPSTLRQYRLGDFISGGLAWTRPVRLGGVQIESNFALRPDLITEPLPLVTGTVAVPSTLNVLVNGTSLLSRHVQPGPFQIPQLPVVSGAGKITMMLTDALGRQITTTLPFYASSNMLAPGLQSYSVEIGKVRHEWGVLSNDYGEPAGSASYRGGLTPWLTVEAHAEGSPGQLMAGGGVVVNVDNLAVINASAAASTHDHQTGTQFSLGITRAGPEFSFGASATIASPTFRDVAAQSGDPVVARSYNLNASVSLGRFGSLSAAYTAVDYNTLPQPITYLGGTGSVISLVPARSTHVLSLSYSVQLGNVSFNLTGFHDFANADSTGVLAGLTVPLGRRSWASAEADDDAGGPYGQLQAGQSATEIGQWGYQAYDTQGSTSHQFAQLQYVSPVAEISAGVDRNGHQITAQAEAEGAVSYVDDGLFFSNTINNSFAVVDTDGIKNVRVLDENRLVGRTDSAGQLLVPGLQSFQVNHLAIDPSDVPIDATLSTTTMEVRPEDRSGVVVHFPIKYSHGALLKLVDAQGKPLPLGSAATLQPNGTAVPVGYGGEAYVLDLGAANTVSVQLPNGRTCEVHFPYHPVHDSIPTIGPLRCLVGAP